MPMHETWLLEVPPHRPGCIHSQYSFTVLHNISLRSSSVVPIVEWYHKNGVLVAYLPTYLSYEFGFLLL